MPASPSERQDLAKQFRDNVLKLQNCLVKAGFSASEDEIVRAWASYSDSLSATWLAVSNVSNQEIAILMTHISDFRAMRDEWLLKIDAAKDGSGDAILRISPEMLQRLDWRINEVLLTSITEDGAMLVERSAR